MPETTMSIKSCNIDPSNIESEVNKVMSDKTFDKWLLTLSEQIESASQKWADPKCTDLTSKLFYLVRTEE